MLGYSLDDFPWAKYHDISIVDTPDLPKHHYFLLGPIVPGFALNDKTWSESHFHPLSHALAPGGSGGLALFPGLLPAGSR